MSTFDLAREWINQITLFSAVFAGFSLAVAVELLGVEGKRKITLANICAFVLAATLLTVATAVGSQMLIKFNYWGDGTRLPHGLTVERVLQIADIAAGAYYVGLGIFVIGLALIGWVHSRAAGIVTSIAAVLAAILIGTLLRILR